MEQTTFVLVSTDDGVTIPDAGVSPKLRAVDWAAPARGGTAAIELFSDEEYEKLRSVLLEQDLPGMDIYIALSHKVWDRERTHFSLDHILCSYAKLMSGDVAVYLEYENGSKYLCRPEAAQVLITP